MLHCSSFVFYLCCIQLFSGILIVLVSSCDSCVMLNNKARLQSHTSCLRSGCACAQLTPGCLKLPWVPETFVQSRAFWNLSRTSDASIVHVVVGGANPSPRHCQCQLMQFLLMMMAAASWPNDKSGGGYILVVWSAWWGHLPHVVLLQNHSAANGGFNWTVLIWQGIPAMQARVKENSSRVLVRQLRLLLLSHLPCQEQQYTEYRGEVHTCRHSCISGRVRKA